jgi:asparagine synthetase B (glutamine-hydrolysing)
MKSPTTQCHTTDYALTTATTRHPDVQKFRPTAIRMGKQVKHRGPDWSGNHIANNTILVHERLSIVGVGECFLDRTHVHTYVRSSTES